MVLFVYLCLNCLLFWIFLLVVRFSVSDLFLSRFVFVECLNWCLLVLII